MREDQLDALVEAVRTGQGVEAALAGMGINSDVAMRWLKAHPNARTRLDEAKQQAQS